MDIQKWLDQAQSLLEKSRADQWEIMASQVESLSLGIRGEEVDKFEQSLDQGLAIRVLSGGKVGFSYLMGFTDSALSQVVEQALASAGSNDLTRSVDFAAGLKEKPRCDIHDPSLAEETLEDKKQRAITLARAAGKADERIAHVHPAEVDESSSAVFLRTSEGLAESYRATRVSAGAAALAVEGDEQEIAWEGHTARFLSEIDPAEIGLAAGRRAAGYLGGAPVGDGVYDVVLENSVSAQFLDVLGQSFMGDNLVKGRSLLADKVGNQSLSPLVSITDEGLLPKGLGTAPFDGEGVAQRQTTLVRKGVIEGFVYDTQWAAAKGLASTGNSVRAGLKTPPLVGFCNLSIKPGEFTCAQMIAGLDKGLFITELMGMHTADPVSGEFSLGVSGFLIESGKVIRPFKSMAMAGRVLDLFGQVQAVGSDIRAFGRTRAPALMVSRMSLSGP